jgi:hypothetical protein
MWVRPQPDNPRYSVRPPPLGYGSILVSEADGTPVTEVRSRTRTWRRCRIVLIAWLAGGAALLAPVDQRVVAEAGTAGRTVRAALVGATDSRAARPPCSGEHRDADDFTG